MTELTHALRRDDLGFLTRRLPKPAERSRVRWMATAMVLCWIGASLLSIAISLSWLP